MNKNKGMQLGAVLAAMLLVSMVFVPAVSAQAIKSEWDKKMLESNGVTVNDFETKITDYNKIGDKIVYSGDFRIDVEKNIEGNLERIKSKGTFKGVINANKSIQVEYSGNDFKSNTNIVKAGTTNGNTTYQVKEVVTYKGKTKNSDRTFELPETEAKIATNSQESGTVNALLTKVDLQSFAPWGSILVFNDVQYADILAGGVVAAAILAYYGVPGVIAGIIVAVGYAIPEWMDIEPRNIYVDIFYVWYLPMGLYAEVDYYYI